MLSHITLGTNDFDRALGFYDKVLAPLGINRTETSENTVSPCTRAGTTPSCSLSANP